MTAHRGQLLGRTLSVFFVLSVLLSFHGIAGDPIFKQFPWPPLSKVPGQYAELATSKGPRPASSPLFSTSIHADTTSFTPIRAGLPGVIASDAVWIDYDNDGDLDVLLSGVADTSKFLLRLYTNDHGVFTQSDALLDSVVTEHGMAWGDYDNDGDFDLAIGGRIGMDVQPVTRIYRNDGGKFTDIHAPLMQLNGCTITWIDYDLDGDLDLLVTGSPDIGNTFYTRLYRNDGGTFTDIGAGFAGVWGAATAWGDYDNDGYPDLALSGYGEMGVTGILYHNEGGTGEFTPVNAGLRPVNSGSSVWADMDNDGDPDLVYTGTASGGIAFATIYRNDGNGVFTDLHPALAQLNVTAVAVGDFDNDGDMDLALSGAEDWLTGVNPTTKIYRNEGNGVFTDIDANLTGTWFGGLHWGDYDNDGNLDLIVTGGTVGRPSLDYPGPYFPVATIYHNNTLTPNLRPASPAIASSIVTEGEVRLTWTTSSDDHTPVNVLTYNLRVGTSPAGSDVLAPAVNVATGYLRVPGYGNSGHLTSRLLRKLEPGTYYWSVQSIDNEYSGSPFPAEQVFVIPPPQSSATVSVSLGWNLISSPVIAADNSVKALFDGAGSPAFAYNGGQYEVSEAIEAGRGYWLKFPVAGAKTLIGLPLAADTIAVHRGWNLIGSIGLNVATRAIVSNPPGIVTSNFFRYNGSYVTTPTISPGLGYWVKVNQDGFLILASGGGAVAGTIRIVPTPDLPPSPPDGENQETPAEFALFQNYPNPFNPVTHFEFRVAKSEDVTLQVFDMLGREVATLVREVKVPGTYDVQWDAAGQPTGVYYYRLKAGSYIDTRKLVLIR